MANNIVKFEAGKRYWDTSAVDHEDVMVIEITRRTEKSVWFVRVRNGKPDGEPARTKIYTDATREYIMPYKYSMAPVWEADREMKLEAAEQTAPEADAMTPDEPETDAVTQEAAPETEAAQKTETADAQTETRLDIAAFYAKYVEEYGFCKDNGDNVAGFAEAAKAFGAFCENEANAALVREFCAHMGDYIASDREAAAFMFALESMSAPPMCETETETEGKVMTLLDVHAANARAIEDEEIFSVKVLWNDGDSFVEYADVAEAMNEFGADKAVSAWELDGTTLNVWLAQPAQETPDSGGPDALKVVRILGETLNLVSDNGDEAEAMKAQVALWETVDEFKRRGVALKVEYDANGRFVNVREAEAGQPAPQETMTPENRIDALFHELAPVEGKADTVAGEIVRAVCRIGYRYSNDGDYVGYGYGKETCNPAARYLMANAGEDVAEIVCCLWAAGEECGILDDGSYGDWLSELVRAALVYLDEHPELKTTPNAEDYWNYRDPNEDVDEWDDEDEDEWGAA